MCSFLAIHINELKLVFLLAYRPPPNFSDNRFYGQRLEASFNNIVIKNAAETISNFGEPHPDVILAGDFNFPKANTNLVLVLGAKIIVI